MQSRPERNHLNARTILMGSGVAAVAAVAAAGAMAGNGHRSAVTTVKAVSGPPKIVVNKYIQDNLHWDKNVYKVSTGGTIHVVNQAADEGPHTFTIVKKADAPKTGLQVVNCRICNALGKGDGGGPHTRTPPPPALPPP